MQRRKIFCFVMVWVSVLSIKAQNIKLTPYASNLGYAIDIRNCNDNRLFVADRIGLIRVVDPNGTTRTTPFLDFSSKISSTQSEEGFLGFCFSPAYLSNGKFYVCYTTKIDNDLYTIVEEYKVSGDPNIADINSGRTIIAAKQPFSNHKGGSIFFGKDGYLYIPLGDGGSGGDPYNNAQNNAEILGKILRIDVNNATSASPYSIPATNPFYNVSGNVRREIWGKGLRNPWRTSIDRITGDIWIADVGQGKFEEIDLQPSNSKGGENYGWRIREGKSCYDGDPSCNSSDLVKPIYDYGHNKGKSIIGGYVYRGVQSKSLWGLYIYSDFTGQWIDGLKQTNYKLDGDPIELLGDAGGGPISFGEDRLGELYVCLNDNGTIYKISEDNSNPTPKAYFKVALNNNSYTFNALEGTGFTYQWYRNDVAIPGATNTSYQPTENGVYKLRVRNSQGNVDLSDGFAVGSALPVSFGDISAQKIQNGLVRISWTTETEQNNRGFELQRKLQYESDFRSLGFVSTKAANGNSATTIQYSYDDTVKQDGIVQYRLKQIDNDANFKYSPVATVNTGNQTQGILIAPNPAQGWIQISTNVNDTYQYFVTDVNGKIVLRDKFKGTQHKVSTMSLGKGVYYLKIQSLNTQEVVTKTLVIDKN